MALLDYVDVPSYASPLRAGSSPNTSPRPAPRVTTALPHPDLSPVGTPTLLGSPASAGLTSPTTKQSAFNLPAILLSSALPAGTQSNPRSAAGAQTLLSTRDPLSIPITTTNFRRFVSKCGPVFWLQDRVEEVVMWRKGWKVTGVWMAAYAFLCACIRDCFPFSSLTACAGYFPRLVLLLPLVTLIGILLATYPSTKSTTSDGATPMPSVQPGEGSVDWQANLQAIQNLMGA